MTWTINGTDPKTLGLVTASVSGWRDAPQRKRITATIPGVPGARVLDADPPEASRRFTAACYVIGTSAADARTKLDTIVALFTAGPLVQVIFADQLTRQVTCEVESITVAVPDAQMIERKIPLSIALVANDPFAYDTAQTAINVIATPSALPLGTGPTRPAIQIGSGAGSSGANPVLTAKNSAGVVIGTMSFTIGFGAADVLIIDCAKKTVTFNGASRLDLLTGGDFFVFDVAKHGVFSTSTWPTLANSIAATATTTARYNKAWR